MFIYVTVLLIISRESASCVVVFPGGLFSKSIMLLRDQMFRQHWQQSVRAGEVDRLNGVLVRLRASAQGPSVGEAICGDTKRIELLGSSSHPRERWTR